MAEKLEPIHEWHHHMLVDHARNAFYDQLVQTHCKDKVIFEIGTGSGLLAALAIQHGASHVYCCEENPLMALAAASLFQRLGLSERITLFRTNSKNILTHQMPAVDIILHELFASDPFAEGMIPTLRDAARFLKPDGMFLPEKIQILYKPILQKELCEKLAYGGIELVEMNLMMAQVFPKLRFDEHNDTNEVFRLPHVTVQTLITEGFEHIEVNPALIGVDALAMTYLIQHQDLSYKAAAFGSPGEKKHWSTIFTYKNNVASDRVHFSIKDEKKWICE
jgi:predicted RNA methylase